MGTKLNEVPTTEKELNELLQKIYLTAKKNYDEREQGDFTSILEIIASEPNIISGIHKIKTSNIAGVDKKVMNDYLEKGYDEVLQVARSMLYDYKPEKVRRAWIPKPGKSEKRPLGISTIIDRIVQECVRNVLESIAEAQFFAHSYGFWPMRSVDMIIARIKRINGTSKCHWVVEGDIL